MCSQLLATQPTSDEWHQNAPIPAYTRLCRFEIPPSAPLNAPKACLESSLLVVSSSFRLSFHTQTISSSLISQRGRMRPLSVRQMRPTSSIGVRKRLEHHLNSNTVVSVESQRFCLDHDTVYCTRSSNTRRARPHCSLLLLSGIAYRMREPAAMRCA